MFGFLKKKWFKEQPTIEALRFPTFGWNLVQDGPPMKQWFDPNQTQSLTVNFFDVPPDLPTMRDIDELRQFFRTRIAAAGGGIIEVELATHAYGRYVKTIFKFPQQPTGMTYLGSLVFPFKEYSYVVKIQAMEVRTTGMRDTLICNQLLSAGELELTEDGFKNWARDPYDATFEGGSLMNLSEAEAYDAQFEQHPLSQVRQTLHAIEAGLELDALLGEIAAFEP
jgi:hypothetical protein